MGDLEDLSKKKWKLLVAHCRIRLKKNIERLTQQKRNGLFTYLANQALIISIYRSVLPLNWIYPSYQSQKNELPHQENKANAETKYLGLLNENTDKITWNELLIACTSRAYNPIERFWKPWLMGIFTDRQSVYSLPNIKFFTVQYAKA